MIWRMPRRMLQRLGILLVIALLAIQAGAQDGAPKTEPFATLRFPAGAWPDVKRASQDNSRLRSTQAIRPPSRTSTQGTKAGNSIGAAADMWVLVAVRPE